MLFDLAYLSASGSRMDAQNAQVAERLAKLVGPEIATGDMEEATRIMAQMAPDAALVADAGGNVLAGSAPEKLIRRGDAFPVLGPNGERIATLYAGNIVPRGLLIPLPIMLSTTLIVVGIAYWLASYFSRTTSGQVEGLAETLRQTAEGRLSRTSSPNIVFEEFRRLQVVIVRTIRKLRADNERLLQAAFTDERTGLGNSARLTQELTETIAASSFEEPAAYVLLEAEGLQQFSEGHGTLLPNEVHTAIAKRLTHFVSAQEKDYSMPLGSWPVFSLQSDEFAILVDRIGGRAEVMRFVRAVLDALRQPYEIAGQSIRLPARAGIVIIPEDGQAPQEIRKRAESALYQSRRADDLDIQFYSPKLDRQTAARKRLESEVRAAVEQRRFIPVFQPKIDLRTGRIAGAEALARWKLESGRIVSPGVFIPVAESTGLIGEIGMQITEQACRAAAMWHSRGFRDVSVAVNVSPLQFEDDDLGAMLIRAMSEAGLPPRLLQLEITESVAVSDPERLKDVIGPLKTMGVRLAIDDFGTGHSNLSMLGRLPFDVFKIDRAFISSLYTDKQAPAIVEMILGMAETLGMETVAEGVETEAQESFLRQRGCDQYQGFYYSPPVSLEKFIQMLAADRAGAASQAG
ncbi:EAL domain-containing protein [Henriciella mobilis]|uniref:putative bifunctional diguanylate cyclase/phosphodiesterase n=1 Tax=Henriciella mobilis TaxID=2305467 RepID=UPI000E673F5D|nr:GGDEF domain-containing phosphodiesterase [Henriciella mobilis]RIJ17910.1 EAL domain-containing protein [Henriciella mobilis]RIJ25278.1 EAL domain-containing protein [Henriciella mobilis]